jgi:Na+/H+ antiporter NhaD/arsenite permease-like protein
MVIHQNEFKVSNIHSWIALFAFIFTIICVITSPKISFYKLWIKIILAKEKLLSSAKSLEERKSSEILKQKIIAKKYLSVTLDIGLAPIISIIFLFATTTLNTNTFLEGIIENEKIKPYSVLILFMSLSYCCISLDMTGLFEYIAIRIIIMAKQSGLKLYFGFCMFASVLTVFPSNDIVIMTFTPIICSVTVKTENIDPIPFMISQFFLANIWSMTLMIGNPTNVIVAEAVDINFVTYSKWLALPTIIAGLTCQIMLYYIFRRKIPFKVIKKI